MRLSRMVLSVAWVLLAGANLTAAPSGTAEIDRQRKLWSKRRPDSYTFVTQRLCECGGSAIPVAVVVEHGRVVRVTRVGSDQPMPSDAVDKFNFSIDDLFQNIKAALARGADRTEIRWHPIDGYPMYVHINGTGWAQDGDVTIETLMLRLRAGS